MRSRSNQNSERSPSRLLLWVAIAGLIFGLIGFGELPEDVLRAGRNSLHPHAASGNIVLVKIDDGSLRKIGRWPWPRRYHAQLTDRLTKAGANRIFFDTMFENASDPLDDRLFADAIRRSGRVTLPVRARTGLVKGAELNSMPIETFSKHAELGSISARYNYQNAVWVLPYGADLGGKIVPSYAAKLANAPADPDATFPIDYSIDPKTIPSVSAEAVLAGSFSQEQIAGKDVMIGVTSDAIGDQYFIPGWGKMGGVLRPNPRRRDLALGRPVHLGWFPAYLLALGLAAVAAFRRNAVHQDDHPGRRGRDPVARPGAARSQADLHRHHARAIRSRLCRVGPGLAALPGARPGQHGSGLANLNALRANRSGRDQALIVARILNYAEIVATLPPDSERQVVEQIVGRLSVGSSDRTFYQGDGGIFAWFEEAKLPFGNHIDALYSLFRTPVRVGSMPIDVSVSFGVEIGSSRSLANRLGSALVAAEEAAHDGLKWKYHDPDSLQDASWKLSMLSQLDSAIDKGEVWVAYQPKLNLATRRDHRGRSPRPLDPPGKGPIAASEFVAAAEQHGRIGKLTDFVLDQAVAAAALLNSGGGDFNVAVNLSARLLTDRNFTLRLSALLARHGVEPRHLTLELTETAALAGSGEAVDMLLRLRELGVNISIDDYGTGLSTLDYLKKIPASEIKIDQSFVKAMCENRSDRLMVQSTIGLAHSLGRTVVAEGVERADILEALVEMKCDLAQGFIIGRPMSLESLIKRTTLERKRSYA